jgi:hypothetical protein
LSSRGWKCRYTVRDDMPAVSRAALVALRILSKRAACSLQRMTAEFEQSRRKVVTALLALGVAAYNLPGYCGPCLGRPEVQDSELENARRDWAEAHATMQVMKAIFPHADRAVTMLTNWLAGAQNESGGFDQVVACASADEGERWQRLYLMLEEQYALASEEAKQPLKLAEAAEATALQATSSRHELCGVLGELRKLIAVVARSSASPTMALANLQPPPPEFGAAEESAAQMLANRFRGKLAKKELKQKKAQRKARNNAAQRRWELARAERVRHWTRAPFTLSHIYTQQQQQQQQQQRYHPSANLLIAAVCAHATHPQQEGADKIGAVFKGLMTRRWYSHANGIRQAEAALLRASQAKPVDEPLLKKDKPEEVQLLLLFSSFCFVSISQARARCFRCWYIRNCPKGLCSKPWLLEPTTHAMLP